MKQHPLTKPLRQPGRSKEASSKPVPFGRVEKKDLFTADDQPTLAAVCKHLWPDLQRVRKWIPSTARQYSSTMIKYVLPYFSKVSFPDLDEDDILGAWANFLLKAPSHSTIQTASTVIRALMELAYERGLTRTTLWGLPLDDSLPSSPVSDQEDIDEQEGKTFAERLRVPKTISLEKEIALVQALLDICHEHGEAIACLAMVWGGTRTSEATGLSYNSLTEVSAGYWALIRYEVSDKDSRDTHDGGKTSNSYRLLPIPPILAQLLLERKAQFQHAHPHADVDNAPLACKGTDLTKRCTQKEVNQLIKSVYRQVGVAENLVAQAYRDIADDPELGEECEHRATAYLCRRQYATSALYCGLTPGEICVLMGHAITDGQTQKSDFSNPDQFRKLADKLFRRPLTQAFMNFPGPRRYTYSGTPLTPIDDVPVEITFSTPQTVCISAASTVPGDLPEITISSGVTIRSVHSDVRPFSILQEPLSLRQEFRHLAQDALVQSMAAPTKIKLPEERDAAQDWAALLDAASDCLTVRPAPQTRADRTPALPDGSFPAALAVPAPVSPPADTPPVAESQDSPPSRPSPAPCPINIAPSMAMSSIPLYLLSDDLRMLPISSQQEIGSRGRAGSRLPSLSKNFRPLRLIPYDDRFPALVLSPDGILYPLPEGSAPDLSSDHPALRALAGGILLQDPILGEPEACIVCLSAAGKVRRVSLSSIKRISPEGRRLVTPDDSDHLVSACLCTETSEILLLSKAGRGLRLAADGLSTVSTPGSGLSAGIKLHPGDQAAICVPYTAPSGVLLISQNGMALRLAPSFRVLSHGRGTSGTSIFSLPENDQLIAALPPCDTVLLLNSRGKTLCIPTSSIRAVSSAAKGVAAMGLSAGQHLLSAAQMIVPKHDENTL